MHMRVSYTSSRYQPLSRISLSKAHSVSLKMRELDAEDRVDLICRHHDGYRNAIFSDEFGKGALKGISGIRHQIRHKTLIEGAAKTMAAPSNVLCLIRCLKPLKGITLSAELVREWINAFLITSNVSLCCVGVFCDIICINI